MDMIAARKTMFFLLGCLFTGWVVEIVVNLIKKTVSSQAPGHFFFFRYFRMGEQEEKGWLETTKSWALTVAGINTSIRLHSDHDEVQTEFTKKKTTFAKWQICTV